MISLYQVEGGSRIRGNDDANNGPDSLITQNFNKDAEHVIRISDHLSEHLNTFIELRPSDWNLSFLRPFPCSETVIPRLGRAHSERKPGGYILIFQEKLYR